MKCVKLILSISVFALAGMVAASTARADTITSNAWVVTEAQATNFTASSFASLANLAVTAGFTGTNLSLSTSGNTLGTWLGSSSPAAAPIVYHNSYTSSTFLDPTLWQFTGTAHFVNGGIYSVTHDDGVVVIVGGTTELNLGGPFSAAPSPFTFTGITGNYATTIDYGECCNAPAVLTTSGFDFVVPPTATPEPGSLVMLGSGLIGLVALRRRKLAA